MVKHKLHTFKKGWIIGNFDPSLLITKDIEVAIKHYIKGNEELSHHHKIATEWTCIVKGRVSINDIIYEQNDIIQIFPNEIAKFKALEDTITVVIKTPSVKDDKYV